MKMQRCLLAALLVLAVAEAARMEQRHGFLRAAPSKTGKAPTKEGSNHTANASVDLPVRPFHLKMYGQYKEPAKNSTENVTVTGPSEEIDDRLAGSHAFGKESAHPPMTPSVAMWWARFMAAWSNYKTAKATHEIKAECAAALQSTMTEFQYHACSGEFWDHLEFAERGETYCRWFNTGYGTSLQALERRADTWCGTSKCESTIEELAYAQMMTMEILQESAITETKASLLEAQRMVRKYGPTWEARGCKPSVCKSLSEEAARVSEAKTEYVKLGPKYESYISLLAMESLVVYDISTSFKC